MNKKIVLITGASRGIGKFISTNLKLKNYFVIGTSTSLSGVKFINENLFKNKIFGKGILLNFENNLNIKDILEKNFIKFGYPSILINNVGINIDNVFIKMKKSEWEKVINVNLISLFEITKICLIQMLKNKWGRIINISSVLALTGNFGQTNYTASKSGILGFSKSLALEVASRGITVNCISPGFIDTDMTDNLPEKVKSDILNKIPVKRFGKPSDVSNVVNFLISDVSDYITGENINVNGGLLMY